MPLTSRTSISHLGDDSTCIEDTEGISPLPDHSELLERFEALRLELDSSPIETASLDSTQDDNFMVLTRRHPAVRSAPELRIPEPKEEEERASIDRVPFIMMFDPQTSRAGRQPLARGRNVDFTKISDREFRTLLESLEGLNFEMAMETYSQYASRHHFTQAQVCEHMPYIALAFNHIDEEMLVRGLRMLHVHYNSMSNRLFSEALDALGFQYEGAQRMDLFIRVRRVSELVRELVVLGGQYQTRPIGSPSTPGATFEPKAGSYALVIVDEGGEKKMWIGKGLHYNVARGKKMVYFAGNIEFNDNHEVVSIDDRSGGYHGFQLENPAVRAKRREQLSQVLEEMGLPSDKFNSQLSEMKSNDADSQPVGGSARLPRRHFWITGSYRA